MAHKFAVFKYVRNNVRIFLRKRDQKRKEMKNAIRQRIRILLNHKERAE